MFHTIRQIYNLCGSYKSKLVSGIVFSTLHAVFHSLAILAILNILVNIDILTPLIIWRSVWILLLSVAGRSLFKYLINMTMSANGYKVFCEKRLEIGDKLKFAPMGYFSDQNLGRISTALSTSFAELEGFAMVAVDNMISGIVQAVCVMIFMFLFKWEIGFVTLCGLVLSMLALNLVKKRTAEQAPRRETARENMISKTIEYIKGISVVKAFGGQSIGNMDAVFSESRDAYISMEKKVMIPVNLYKGILEVFSGLIVLVASYLMLIHQLTFSVGIMFLISAFMVYGQMEYMGNGAFLLRLIDHALSHMEQVMNIPVIDQGASLSTGDCNIELRHVCFGYDSRETIKDVSFKVPQNSSVAIVGYSGSGKTTLCNLIARFWDVNSGEILFGKRNVKDYPSDELLSHISMVFQNVYLFNDTIANNIRFGKPDATMEEITVAAKKACCYDFIMELPNEFDTLIGEGGSTLSGGEKQRVSIARAILKDAPVVILDEATSSVDPENEHMLLRAIQELTKNKTLISIAHRMTTVKNADQILVMDDGKIVQQGTHNQLITQEGIYKNFLKVREQSAGWQLSFH